MGTATSHISSSAAVELFVLAFLLRMLLELLVHPNAIGRFRFQQTADAQPQMPHSSSLGHIYMQKQGSNLLPGVMQDEAFQ
jgi:hypothetical protein